VALIELESYNSTILAEELSALKGVENLEIRIGSGKWIIAPPCSGMLSYNTSTPYTELPIEITKLNELVSLKLIGLGLGRLPESFNSLGNLRTLDLTLNKLNITSELAKLELINLDTLIITGNRYDTILLAEWEQNHPNTKILNYCDG